MASASIKLDLTPREFDVLRTVLESERTRALGVIDDRHTDVEIRHTERKHAAELSDLLAKLR